MTPIRERREKFEQDPAKVYQILKEGSKKANQVAEKTLQEVRDAMGINYFN